MNKRIVVISDTQHPYEDSAAVRAVLKFIEVTHPDEVVHIGDLADFPQASEWNKGTAEEFRSSVYKDAAYVRDEFLGPLRDVFEGPIGVLEGNHDERVDKYVKKYAAAISGTDLFKIESLLHFEKYGVVKLPSFYEFAKGWVMFHGHKGGVSDSRTPLGKALSAAKKFDRSVIMGHTHRLGRVSETYGFGGKITKTLHAVEVGHLCDPNKIQYVKDKESTEDWQQGFCVIDIHGDYVNPVLVPICNGTFVVDGRVYEV